MKLCLAYIPTDAAIVFSAQYFFGLQQNLQGPQTTVNTLVEMLIAFARCYTGDVRHQTFVYSKPKNTINR